MIARKLLWVFLIILLAACASAQSGETPESTSQAERPVLTVYTHDSFDVSESVVAAFQEQANADVRFISGGDAGTALNKLILSKENPPADVFYGVDNTFLSRALQEGIFVPYASPLLAEIPDQFKLDPEQRALPVDYGDVCLNYDRQYFTENNLDIPGALEDLLKPEYRSLLVVENPATSSPGLAFLLTTIGHFGDPGYLDFWQALADNDVKVVNDWETAYYTEFTRWGGTRPLVVSYGSSPSFEALDAESPVDEPPTGAIVADDTCFRQVEFVGILAGTGQESLAHAWVDFMLSPTFQEDMPLHMYVFPVNPQASLDEAFKKFLAIPEHPVQLDPALIAANREKWIQSWTELVLR
ncbi:MAG: thiamine ABC transporter substrate binding subunit [Anaerolineales bacterium]|jgi:thiamine transport system substrate-binding protein